MGLIPQPRAFKSVKEFEEAVLGYFEWADANPLEKPIWNHKTNTQESMKIPRPYFLQALLKHINVSDAWWYGSQQPGNPMYKKNFQRVFEYAKRMRYERNVGGAALDYYNPAIVSRIKEHGLHDRQEISGPDGKPLEVESSSSDVRDRMLGLMDDASASSAESK